MTRLNLKKHKRDQPERRERFAFMQWVSLRHNIRKYLFAIENGGSRDKREAANIKKMGLVGGVPDYLFMKPHGRYHGLWLEFKADYGAYKNKLTANQKQFFKIAREVGYKCEVVWSWEDGVKIIENYLKGELRPDSTVLS
jgi:hypothetical protein